MKKWNCFLLAFVLALSMTGLSKADSNASAGLTIVSVTQQSDGNVEVVWKGGKAPYKLTYEILFNKRQNTGSEVHIINKEANHYSENKAVLHYLVPGQKYWLHLIDTEGKECWHQLNNPMNEAKAISGKVKLTNRQKVNKRASTLNAFSAYLIKQTMSDTNYAFGGTVKLVYNRLARDTTYFCRMVMTLPNQDVVVFAGGPLRLKSGSVEYASYGFLDFQEAWERIYRVYGTIPEGKYSYSVYLDQWCLGRQDFTMNP